MADSCALLQGKSGRGSSRSLQAAWYLDVMRKQSSGLFKFTNSVFVRVDCPQRSLSHASATQCHGFLSQCPDTVMREAEEVAPNEVQDSDLRPGSKVSLRDCTQVRGAEYPERACRKFLMGILNLKVTLDPAGPPLQCSAVIAWHQLDGVTWLRLVHGTAATAARCSQSIVLHKEPRSAGGTGDSISCNAARLDCLPSRWRRKKI